MNKEIQFQYRTNLKKRFLASFIDYLIIFILTFLYIQKFGEITEDGAMAVSGIKTVPLILIWLIYFVGVEGYQGATLGHKALNLLVLKENRKPIDFIDAFKRHLLDPFDFFMFAIPAIIAINNTDRKQRLGDLWAKTIVVDLTDNEQIDSQLINIPQ